MIYLLQKLHNTTRNTNYLHMKGTMTDQARLQIDFDYEYIYV